MGTWGIGSFDNDTAMDWAYGLKQSSEITILGETIAKGLAFVSSDEEMDADTACEVLAAAEVVAALRGKSVPNLPEDVKVWIEKTGKAASELVKGAFLAVKALREKSELKELWEETDECKKWLAVVDNLIERLK